MTKEHHLPECLSTDNWMENHDALVQRSWVKTTQPQKKEIAPFAEKWLAHIWAQDFVYIYKNMRGDNYQVLV